MDLMKNRNRFRFVVRILATVGLLIQRVYFGPVGAGAGLIEGLIIAAIWITREKDSEE